MGLKDDVPRLKAGVVTGGIAWGIFQSAKKYGTSVPAFDVNSIDQINALLAGAAETGENVMERQPVVLQLTRTGAANIAGSTLPNEGNAASIAGAISAALHVRTMAPMYGVSVILSTGSCSKDEMSWVDGLIKANQEFHERSGEPLFSSHQMELSLGSGPAPPAAPADDADEAAKAAYEKAKEENPLGDAILQGAKDTMKKMKWMNMILHLEMSASAEYDSSNWSKHVHQVWEALNQFSEKVLIELPGGAPKAQELQAYVKEKYTRGGKCPVSFAGKADFGNFEDSNVAGVVKKVMDSSNNQFGDAIKKFKAANTEHEPESA